MKTTIYFFLGVIITIVIGNSIIFFAESDSKIIYANWILIINSLTAAGLSAMIFIKDKDSNEGGDKTNILLTLGLIFWFIANIIWAYYEVVLDIVSPVPSLADLFLMSAYGFIIYRLISIYDKLGNITNKKILILIISGTGLFLVYILNLTLDLTELTNFRGLMLFIVTIAYPTLNSILTILAMMILLKLKDEKHHFIPWVCELIGFLAIVVGDSWFAIIVLTAFVEQLWMSALLLSAHYLLIAAGLIWYLRYYIKWQSKDLIYKTITSINRNTNFKKVLFSSTILISFLLLASFIYTNVFSGDENKEFFIKKSSSSSPQLSSSDYNENIQKDFVIGAILPYTGAFSSLGKSVKVALEKAEYDVNKYFEQMNSSSHFSLLMANSKTSSEDSLMAIKKLHEHGVNIIVGPSIGSTVLAAKGYADANNITLISYSSTSSSLSIEGDSLFRLVPDDIYQGMIVAERMIKEGIKVIVPIWRGGLYSNDLYKSTKFYFEKLGGEVEDGINYKPYTGKFATSLHRINFLMWNQELEKLNAIVADAIKKYGANSVAVYVISFDEITPILIQSTLYENLGKVRWYGSDKIAQNHQLTKNVDSASFAMKTNLSNPVFSIDSESKKYHDLKEVLEKQLHEVSSITYSALAYDSYWIAALSLDKNNTTFNNSNENLTKKSFQDIIRETADSFSEGISGKIKFNKAGDRIGGNYDFWIVAKDNDTQSYEWEKEHNFRIEN
ncbi:MAG TPA: ABC transporter substrate-binding protein [Nitrososphaeraceae archaeon]|nr:ABC transporter substrate-binding protein [Nitrososphaeraceae archaeon]